MSHKFYVSAIAGVFFGAMIATQPSAANAQTAGEVLAGRWVIDDDKTREEGGTVISDVLDQGFELTIEFKRDGFTSEGKLVQSHAVGGQRETHEGTWKVLKEDGQSATLELQMHKPDRTERLLVQFIEGDKFIKVGEANPEAKLEIIFVLRRADAKK